MTAWRYVGTSSGACSTTSSGPSVSSRGSGSTALITRHSHDMPSRALRGMGKWRAPMPWRTGQLERSLDRAHLLVRAVHHSRLAQELGSLAERTSQSLNLAPARSAAAKVAPRNASVFANSAGIAPLLQVKIATA